jgi:hypothetical protein
MIKPNSTFGQNDGRKHKLQDKTRNDFQYFRKKTESSETKPCTEFGLRPHSSNGVNGDHNNGDLEPEEDAASYLEEDAADDGEPTTVSKPTSLADRLSSAKTALLSFRLPTATEMRENYINSNFHKSLHQPLVVKTRVEATEVQKSRQVLTQVEWRRHLLYTL